MAQTSCRFRVSNRSTEDKTLHTEPWGTAYPLPAGKTYEVVVSGDLAHPFEVEWQDGHVTVYALDADRSSTVTVYDGGRALA